MQYQVTCKHCHRLFAITSQPGQTVKASCPYCSTIATIATPYAGQQANETNLHATSYPPQTPSSATQRSFQSQSIRRGSLGLKVVKVYIAVMLILILGASALYWLFSTMSQ